MKLPHENAWKPALATPHWRPAARRAQQLGQAAGVSVVPSYSTAVMEKLTGFGMGALGGLLVGSLFNTLMPSIRQTRQLALIQAGMAATLGAIAVVLPFRDGALAGAAGILSMLSGVSTGTALASVTVPKRRTA